MTTALFGDDDGVRELSLVEKKNTGEHPDQSTIIYKRDGFLDDSLRGDWHEKQFQRQANGSWRVSSAKVAYRCWRRDNVDAYQEALCP